MREEFEKGITYVQNAHTQFKKHLKHVLYNLVLVVY